MAHAAGEDKFVYFDLYQSLKNIDKVLDISNLQGKKQTHCNKHQLKHGSDLLPEEVNSITHALISKKLVEDLS